MLRGSVVKWSFQHGTLLSDALSNGTSLYGQATVLKCMHMNRQVITNGSQVNGSGTHVAFRSDTIRQ